MPLDRDRKERGQFAEELRTGFCGLFMDGEEAFFIREDAVRRDVTEASNEHQEADKLQVISRHQFETQKVCLYDEHTPHGQTGDENPHLAGYGLTWSGTQPAGEYGQRDDDERGEHDDTVRDVELRQADTERGSKDSENGEEHLSRHQPAEGPPEVFSADLVKEKSERNKEGAGDVPIQVSPKSGRLIEKRTE